MEFIAIHLAVCHYCLSALNSFSAQAIMTGRKPEQKFIKTSSISTSEMPQKGRCEMKKDNLPIRKKGGIWCYRIKIPDEYGVPKWVERSGGKTKRDCIAAYYAALNAIDEGSLLASRNVTVKKLFEVWFTEYVYIYLKPNTQRAYSSAVRTHILPELGHIRVADMTARIVQRFINTRKGLSHASQNHLVCILKAAFSYAVEPCCFRMNNPVKNIRLPKDAARRTEDVHIFTAEEMQRIFEKWPQGHHYYLAINICYHTGLRIGEALGLRWQDVDLENMELSVNGTMLESGEWQSSPKSRSSIRTIPFGEKIGALLKAERRRQFAAQLQADGNSYNPDGFVCVYRFSGMPINPSEFHYFNTWCRNNFGGGSTHCLRHTHATMLLENGVSLEAVSKRLGHSSIGITSKYYSHVTQKGKDDMRAALDGTF